VISSISPAAPTTSAVEQAVLVTGSGFDSGPSIVITRPDGSTINVASDRLRDLTSTSFSFLVSFVTSGAYTIRVTSSTGQSSNVIPFNVGTPQQSGEVATGTTDAAGQTTVNVPNVGEVPVRVTNETGQPVGDAQVAATAGGVAAVAEGYDVTIVLTPASALRVHSLSLQGIGVTLRRITCKVQSVVHACTGGDLAGGLAGPACRVADIVERGLFRCVAGPNLHGESLVAQALVLNAGSVVEKLISRIPLVGCGVTIVSQATGFDLNAAYLNLTKKWYPELQGSTFLVLNAGGKDLFTPFVCPKPTLPRSSGAVSGSAWVGSLSWSVPNKLIKSERVRGWTGTACGAGATAFDVGAPGVNGFEEFASLSVSQAIPSSTRSADVSVPTGTYSWRVETTRLDGSVEHSDCQRLNAGPASGTPAITDVAPRSVSPSTFDMTITGTGFDSGAIDQVYLKSDGRFIGNGQILSRNATQIVVRQAMSGASPAIYQVRVKNSDGTLSNAADFTVTQPAANLAITSVSPTSVVASTFDMTITGTGFDSGAIDQVYLKSDGRFIGNGQILSRNATQIVVRQAMSGASPAIYQVRVKNSDGTLSNAADFTVMQPAANLAITSVSPTSVVASTFDMTITGTGFDSGAIDQVYLKSDGRFIGNGQILSRTATQIVVRQAMSGASPATYQVRVRNGTGALSNALDFTVTANLAISSVSPTSVVASTFDMTITGTGFDGGAIDQVYLKSDGRFIGNGQILSRTGTQIVVRQAMTGASPATYQVRVRNSTGALSNALDFTIR
jgi:CMP-N-acetylneuraminic acid synthetase